MHTQIYIYIYIERERDVLLCGDGGSVILGRGADPDLHLRGEVAQALGDLYIYIYIERERERDR